MLKIMWYSLL